METRQQQHTHILLYDNRIDHENRRGRMSEASVPPAATTPANRELFIANRKYFRDGDTREHGSRQTDDPTQPQSRQW
jgi:hypothetical protein